MSVEQHPLSSNPEESLIRITKELEKLNKNYEKNFHLKEYTLSFQYLYTPNDAYNLRYDNYKKQIDEYNNKYDNKFNKLLKEAIKINPLFTFPNLIKTNPLKVEQFLESPDFIQSAIDEIQYAWKREGCLGIISLFSMSVFSCLIALFLGNIDDLIYISFILAIGCGLFFRIVFKNLLGHKGITLFAILSAIIAVILWNVVFLSAPEFNNGMMYIVLLVYVICL